MRKLSRKEAEEKMEAIFSALHYNLMDAMNAGGERTGEESYFHAEAWKVDQGRQKEDYRQTVMSLDSVGFKEYYKLVGQFATAYKIGCWKEYSECEPVLIEELGEELGRREKTKEKLELINSFTAEELHSQSFSFDAKIKVLQDILDDFSVGNEKEEVINKLLASFSGKDSSAFIARLQSDGKLLNGLLGRVNGGEKDRMLALLGEIFASAGLTAEEKAVPLENKASDTLKATFEQGQVFIDVNSPVPGGMRDYTKAKAKSIMVSPFEIIRMNYDGREIKIPALLLLKSWTNSGATPEGLFHNYYKEDLDWNSLGEEERDAYFAEFVAHYMGQALFSELAEHPLELGVSAIVGILLAHFAAVPAAVMVLVTAGMAGANIYAGSMMLTAALEKKQNSLNMQEHKQAARLFAESIAKIGVNVLMLVVSLVQTGKAVYRGREIRLNKKPKIRIEFNETWCHNHLIYGDGIKTGQGGVSGAHNKNNFYKTLNDKFEPIFRKEGLEFSASDCIEGSIVHPKIPGVEQIRYKLPAMNQNNTVNQGVYKKLKAPKTVYDPSVISDEQMLQWGKEAMKNADCIEQRYISGTASNGLRFEGYIDIKTNTITNFHPVLE